MISWITEKVAIGDYSDAMNRESLIKEKIDCIVCLRRYLPVKEEALRNILKIPLFHISVGSRQGLESIKIELRTATYLLELLSEKYNRILIHCTAGIDRSPFVVACYMARMELECQDDFPIQRDFKHWVTEAYKFIKRKSPQVMEHWEWI